MQYCSESLERDGIPISRWMIRLIDENLQTRVAAAKVLFAIMNGIESVDMDIEDAQFDVNVDVTKHRNRVQRALFASLSDLEIPVTKFLNELCCIEREIRDKQREETEANLAHFNQTNGRLDRIVDRLTGQLNETDDTERSETLTRRLRRVLFTSAPSPYPSSSSIDFSHLPIAIQFVFSSVGKHWLQTPEIIARRLRDPEDCQEALEWIVAIGAEASIWLPVLQELFEHQDTNFPTHAFREAILEIGRHDPEIEQWLTWILDSGDDAQRRDALFLLAELSIDSHKFIQRAIENFVSESEFDFAAFDDLIAIGRHHRFIRLFAIELAKPSPPQWKKHRLGQYSETYDAAMRTRSIALASFRHLGDYIDEFRGVLLEAMDSFEEFDPDWCYDGPHGRISDIIESLGPAAGPLAAPFADRLMDATDEGEYARAMVGALSSIGAGAIDAIPAMQRYRKAIHDLESDGPMVPFSSTKDIDDLDDGIGAAMQLIYRAHQDRLGTQDEDAAAAKN